MKSTHAPLFAFLLTGLLAGCVISPGARRDAPGATTAQPAAAVPSNTRIVKSRDGSFDGEVVGTVAAGSAFSKVQIGMELNEVTRMLGNPVRMTSHETGKRWIPFYYGNDVRRANLHYAGEGCLSFTAGNRFGGGGHELVVITADPTGALCVQ